MSSTACLEKPNDEPTPVHCLSDALTAVLSVGLSGAVYIGGDGVLTVPMLNAWDFTTIKIKDS
ncbi:MAG: hypothetical protein QGF67_11540, partial [Lentisphaeria bacterium]|nr:hypothetical protein [Lentisphaeria bacterium]